MHAPLFFIRALHCQTQMRSSDIPGVQSLPFDWRAAEETSSFRLSVQQPAKDSYIYIYIFENTREKKSNLAMIV